MTTKTARATEFDFSILSASAFEELCLALLTAAKYKLVQIVGNEQRYGDFKGTTPPLEGTKSVTVEVKHRDKFDVVSVRQFVLNGAETSSTQLLYVTSASIDRNFSPGVPSNWIPSGKEVKLIGREKLNEMLVEYPAIAKRFFVPAKKRARLSQLQITVSLVMLVAAAGWGFSFWGSKSRATAATLPDEIAAVQQSLEHIKNLQASLQALQKNLDDTAAESRRIESEYVQAQQLKRLTAADLDGVKAALNHSSLTETIASLFVGFVVGVAGSLAASWLWDRWQRRQERKGSKE